MTAHAPAGSVSTSRIVRRRFPAGAVVACTMALLLCPGRMDAQVDSLVDVRSEVFVGGEYEDYLRWLQTEGATVSHPWSIRSFNVAEVDRLLPTDSLHPWHARFGATRSERGFRFQLVRPGLETTFNSAFPYGANNGPVWAGKGLTTAVRFGFVARHGPLSLAVVPLLFRAENSPFELAPHAWHGLNDFVDPRHPNFIDLPQRFGDEPYSRIDPGQSTLRLDVAGVAAGISTANQYWGPSTEHALILGDNAPGFAHLFLGTSRPVDVRIGQVHARAIWGRLEQSPYSPVEGDSVRRFATGAVGVFTPRWLPNLEIGGARFFQTPWTPDGLSGEHYFKLWESFLKVRMPGKEPLPEEKVPDLDFDPDNQHASVFFRWVFPASGLEVYAEYGREDHAWDVRDFILEPDHSAGYVVGFRKLWRRSESRFLTLRTEVLNTRSSHLHQIRDQAPFYVHAWTRQGHTHRGQLLGSPAGYGGAASRLAGDLYHADGRWTLSWSRTLRRSSDLFADTGTADPDGFDVLHTLGLESVLLRGGWDFDFGLSGVYNLNRNFESDIFNLNASFGVRVGL